MCILSNIFLILFILFYSLLLILGLYPLYDCITNFYKKSKEKDMTLKKLFNL